MHKTVKLKSDGYDYGEVTPQQLDELISLVLSQFGKPVQPLSVAVYELPNFKTGLMQRYMTVVAIERDSK